MHENDYANSDDELLISILGKSKATYLWCTNKLQSQGVSNDSEVKEIECQPPIVDLHKDFDYSQIYSLNQTSLIENLHIKSPKKKGRKPNLVKIKDQIDQGIQTTLDKLIIDTNRMRSARWTP